LQSLLQMSCGFTRFKRDDEAMSFETLPVDTIGVL
jgi:hypothetical protein